MQSKIEEKHRLFLKRIEENRGFVIREINKLKTLFPHLADFEEDLKSAANLGLIEGAINFDEKMGVKFLSYAVWHIKNRIYKTIDSYQSSAIKIPYDRKKKILEYIKGNQEENKDKVTHQEINAIKAPISIEGSRENDSEHPLDELLGNDPFLSLEKEIDLKNFQKLLKETIDSELNEKEKTILSLRFCENPKTLEKIGKEMGLSRERVRQIQKKALKKLRKKLEPYREDIINCINE